MSLGIIRGSPVIQLCLLSLFDSSTTAFTPRSLPYSTVFSAARTTKKLSLVMQMASEFPLGGDYAGLSATFNPKDGSFIPIPEHLVPESLLEWGQEPKCLEVLVSEDIKDDKLNRTTVTIYPAVGCALDNQETTKKTEEVEFTSHFEEDGNTVGLQYSTGDKDIRLETMFGLSDKHRMRVVLDLIVQSESEISIKSPMGLILERQTSSKSSGGTIADGGGLDARTVCTLLGSELSKSKTFAEEDVSQEGLSNGRINFPGNISLTTTESNDGWTCQLSHTQNDLQRTVTHLFDPESRTFKITSAQEQTQV